MVKDDLIITNGLDAFIGAPPTALAAAGFGDSSSVLMSPAVNRAGTGGGRAEDGGGPGIGGRTAAASGMEGKICKGGREAKKL